MGYREITLKYVSEMMEKADLSAKKLTICELGNQQIRDKFKGFKMARAYFESLGMIYTSIDWNGKNGALKLDLNKPIEIGQFDVVTNIGTAEHVENNEQCFENIHNLCKKNGIMIHIAPLVGNWLKHKGCYRRYDIKFFENLRDKYDYEVLNMEEARRIRKKANRALIFCTLRRRK